MASEHPRVSNQIVLPIAEHLAARGLPVERLLAREGLVMDRLFEVEATTPLSAYVAFLESAAETSRDPHLGLTLARTLDAGAIGALSFLFMSAPTLREAFAGFVRFLAAMQDDTQMELRISPEGVKFIYQLRDERIVHRRQDAEYSIAATLGLIDGYVQSGFRPKEIYFEHERVGPYEVYAHYFGCDVYFGQNVNAILFDKAWLDFRSPRISARLFPILTAHLQRAMREKDAPRTLADEVAFALTEGDLETGVTLKDMAVRLGLSERTLARRLAGEGTNFRDLLTERRMMTAERLLAEGRRSVGEIALLVGYGENASFTRAFRAARGQSPRAYRRSLQPRRGG
jgi:AraC-like DNA-binding protein